MALTLLLGGVRSGKSALAVELARRHDGPVTFIATAPLVDEDMAVRAARHRRQRPPEWHTVEEEVDLSAALAGAEDSMVVIDCLTLWTSNLMWRELDGIGTRAATAATQAAAHPFDVVAISNEVGMGVHPETDLGRRYRDTLGRVNQTWAAAAETALLLVAGRALPLADPADLLATDPLDTDQR